MRILFVGWPVCVHTIRWIGNIPKDGYELHLYAWDEDSATGPARHEKVRNGLRLPKLDRVSVHYPRRANDAVELARHIARIKPDAIHSMPVQGASHLVREAKKLLPGRFPPWYVSAWGMSTEVLFGPWLYGNEARPIEKMSDALRSCDYL